MVLEPERLETLTEAVLRVAWKVLAEEGLCDACGAREFKTSRPYAVACIEAFIENVNAFRNRPPSLTDVQKAKIVTDLVRRDRRRNDTA